MTTIPLVQLGADAPAGTLANGCMACPAWCTVGIFGRGSHRTRPECGAREPCGMEYGTNLKGGDEERVGSSATGAAGDGRQGVARRMTPTACPRQAPVRVRGRPRFVTTALANGVVINTREAGMWHAC
ncbi:MAG: hypothetical protein K6T83_19330 [Alicyclobacillus sp.]|nr:hypothetical protein [Alicyclobacillus sp.]